MKLKVKFDGHCPVDVRTLDRPAIQGFRDEVAYVERNDRGFWSARVRGCVIDCCTSMQMAVAWAATEAANVQINVTTIRNAY